ncbi:MULTISPECIES: IclR family transcriptional regulator [unclassified Microbacterium]|uniref:IclR family transcriptional regulator n=1 Tax=unclassified Microbacterium TaxID=2609290 RepID=UPI00143000CD|nr:IclR family transcriptional regulator C-terminal domain-containing protein [Microbacterium sp. B19(2022)]NJI58317.1 helix-turn-helix domain-containing protein [Microbacterium sp. B19(2022)]
MPSAPLAPAPSSSMGRGLDVLTALSALIEKGSGTTVGEIAHALDRERSQVSRTLATLARSGLVERRPDRSYALTWSWYAAAQELTAHRMHTHGLAVLDSLAAQLGEATFLSELQGDATLTTLESLPADSRMIGSWIGRSYPAYCSDAGRATLWDASDDEVRAVFGSTDFTAQGPNTPVSVDDVLARLGADRERGFTIVDQEAEPGLYSVAAPVWDFRGEVIAAVQVVGTRDAMHERVAECGAACARAAADLSRRLGAPASVER